MKKCKYGYAPDRDSTIDGQIEIPTKVNNDDLRGTRCANTFDDSSIPGYSTTDFTDAANEMQQAIAGSRDKQEVEHVPYENFKGLKTETERVINFSDDALVDRIYSDLFKILYAKPESYDMMRELVINLETIFDKYLLLPVNDRRFSFLKNYIITCEKLCESKVEETACESKVEETELRYNPDTERVINFSDDALVDRIYSDLFKILSKNYVDRKLKKKRSNRKLKKQNLVTLR